MAREKIDTSKVKEDTGPVTSGEQADMFRELDEGNDAQKKLKQLSRNWLAVCDEREEMKKDSAQREREAHKLMCDQADSLSLKEFVVGGRVIRIANNRKASQKPLPVKKTKKAKKKKAEKVAA